ncbi:hypothetical protein C9374_008224 [Naegleria lovaniensis]|uniref:Ribosomal protein L2 C-terminal domain-containing protein n=1 Tax=Naegleria lovaniensis TaxID=51637 RepID=A0AA88GK56_NAELO|nr:uncharacterized protein C9374_008224 [Naegleria lovaniensis]KAG2378585.1 hypothetical protein C9374_008224 [Naegleria lovaniensis]
MSEERLSSSPPMQSSLFLNMEDVSDEEPIPNNSEPTSIFINNDQIGKANAGSSSSLEDNNASPDKYGSFIEEFNARNSFPNSIKWCKENNSIALLTNNSICVVNTNTDKRGMIVLHKETESEDGVVTTNHEPVRTSTHFKDRSVIHPSMFVRFLPSCFRSIGWSPPVPSNNATKASVINNFGCLLCCSTSDNNCKIYKKPNFSFSTHWELVCDVRSILQDNDKNLQAIEKEHQISSPLQNIMPPPSQAFVAVAKKTRIHSSKKNSSVMSVEQQFFAEFYKNFTEESGFDPSKKEYQVGYRKWTDEEQKVYDKVLKSTLEAYKSRMEEFNISKESITKNLYIKLRTKMRKDKEKGERSDVVCNIYSPEKEKAESTKKKSKKSKTQEIDATNNEESNESEEISNKRKLNETQEPLESEEQQTDKSKKPKRLYFTRGSARAKDEELSQQDYFHRLTLSEILCFDFSTSFTNLNAESKKRAFYLVCGSKSGFISVFSVMQTIDEKVDIQLIGYHKVFSTFISIVKFLPSAESENYFRVVCASSSGELKFLKIPKEFNQNIEKREDLLSVSDMSQQQFSQYFHEDGLPVIAIEPLFVSSKTSSENDQDTLYIAYAKAKKFFICKFSINAGGDMTLKWRKSYSCQDHIISSISLQQVSIACTQTHCNLNAIMVYTSSLDGSLVQWKIVEHPQPHIDSSAQTPDKYISVTIIPKRSDLPIWGCSLSPNHTLAAIAVERPPLKEIRIDFEHRSKTRIYIIPLFMYAIRAIYQIPQDQQIPSAHIIDYFTTKITKGLTCREQLFDIAACLTQPDMSHVVEAILDRSFEHATTNQDWNLKKSIYFLYSNICTEATLLENDPKYLLLQKKITLGNCIRHFYATELLDFLTKQESNKKTQLLLCDWLLLYYDSIIKKYYWSASSYQTQAPLPSHNCIDKDEVATLTDNVAMIRNLKTITQALTTTEDPSSNMPVLHFALTLHSFFSNNPKLDGTNTENTFTLLRSIATEQFVPPPRDTCPICSPSHPSNLPMQLGAQFTHSTCPKHHPITRDTFTFEIIRDPVYDSVQCRACAKTNTTMGKRIRAQRKGNGAGPYKTRSIHKIAKPQYRKWDFSEREGFMKGVVRQILHEPGRGAPLAEVVFRDPLKPKKDIQHFLAPEGLYTGQFVFCGKKAELKIGNVLPIGNLPEGTVCCNVERKTGDRGALARAAGESAVIIAHSEDGKTRVKLPSGVKKTLPSDNRATVGVIACGGKTERPVLKASTNYFRFKAKGRKQWPRVRGVAMNPVEHPHGGGNHQHIGKPSTVSRWTPAGRKVGLIAARRTGRIRGGKQIINQVEKFD